MNSSLEIDIRNTGSILNIELSRKLTLIFLIILIFPSFICSCFILYLIIRKKIIRNRFNNHLVICIFLIYFIQATCDLPFTLVYLYHGHVAFSSDIFCKYWLILLSALDICSVQLNAYLSIERYLLIFHSQFLHKYKITFHYLPMIVLFISPFFFMIGLVNFYPCENHFDYTAWACGTACYTLERTPSTASWIYGLLAPLFIILTSNAFLIVRVMYQKRRMSQRNVWKKNKKMLLQLLSVTGVLYISWLPISISSVITVLQPNPTLYELQGNWLLVGLIYLAVLFSPLSSLMAMPELKNEIRLWINRWQRHHDNTQIHPVTVTRLQ